MVTKRGQKLKNRRILITAGPTWVPIDTVRVIGNIATGATGILLAEKLLALGNKVTLLLGPGDACCLNRSIKLVRFEFFDELKRLIKKELTAKKFDIVIHSAAVSDYRPQRIFSRKVKSGIKRWKLNLLPTPKIIDSIKKADRDLFLVGFKFEPKARRNLLVAETRSLMRRARLDLAVANTIDGSRYRAYILDGRQIYGPLFNKKSMTDKLIGLIARRLWKN